MVRNEFLLTTNFSQRVMSSNPEMVVVVVVEVITGTRETRRLISRVMVTSTIYFSNCHIFKRAYTAGKVAIT